MPREPSPIEVAEWQVGVPGLLSEEQIRSATDAGFLGIEYDDGTDSRFKDLLILGPELNTVDLSTHDGTASNVQAFVLSNDMHATAFVYAARRTIAKITASTLALADPGTPITLTANPTDAIYSRKAGGSGMLSFAQGSANAYVNITTVANAGAADTSSANDQSQAMQVFGHIGGNADEPRIGGMVGQEFLQNVISSSNDMDDSNWLSRAKIPENVTPTGIAMDGIYVILGTTIGPYWLDNQFLEYRAMIPELRNSPDARNCRNMREWNISGLGILMPLDGGLRFQRNLSGYSIGPEVYGENESPVQGEITAIACTNRFAYLAIYNRSTDQTWLVCMRPRRVGDWHQHDVSYWVIGKLTNGAECEAMEYIGTYGGATTHRIVMGSDSDMVWFILGELAREADDSAYRFTSAGTCYFTELRRFPGYDKQVEWFEFETENCTADRTVTLKVSVDGGTAVAVGAPIASNGFHRVMVDPENEIRGTRIKPQLTLASNSDQDSPKVTGTVRMHYRLVDKEFDNAYVGGS